MNMYEHRHRHTQHTNTHTHIHTHTYRAAAATLHNLIEHETLIALIHALVDLCSRGDNGEDDGDVKDGYGWG
jgi:hypothetical protein